MPTSDRLATFERFLAILVDEQAHRRSREGPLASMDQLGRPTTELAWVVQERLAMFTAVNDIRAARGFDPVHLTEIVRVEQNANGHSDYSRKFALYCAELAVTDAKDKP